MYGAHDAGRARGHYPSDPSDSDDWRDGSKSEQVRPHSRQVVSPDGRFIRMECVGRGPFKQVFRAYDTEEAVEVSWVEHYHSDGSDAASAAKRGQREFNMLCSLVHPNIIKVVACWPDPDSGAVVIIMECLASGSLRRFLKEVPTGKVNERTVAKWGTQILKGLAYLDECGISHRDITTDNIYIVRNTGELKIGDFHVSTMGRGTGVSCFGTPEFMAPETFDEEHSPISDVYSFGMVLLEISTGIRPYAECENFGQVLKRACSGTPPQALKEAPPTIAAIVRRCLLPAEERPRAAELLTDSFFASCTTATPTVKPLVDRLREAAQRRQPTASNPPSTAPSPSTNPGSPERPILCLKGLDEDHCQESPTHLKRGGLGSGTAERASSGSTMGTATSCNAGSQTTGSLDTGRTGSRSFSTGQPSAGNSLERS